MSEPTGPPAHTAPTPRTDGNLDEQSGIVAHAKAPHLLAAARAHRPGFRRRRLAVRPRKPHHRSPGRQRIPVHARLGHRRLHDPDDLLHRHERPPRHRVARLADRVHQGPPRQVGRRARRHRHLPHHALFSVGNAVGSGLGLSMLFGGSPVLWTVICTVAVGFVLLLRNVYRVVEKALLGIVALMASLSSPAPSSPNPTGAGPEGMVPSVPPEASSSSSRWSAPTSRSTPPSTPPTAPRNTAAPAPTTATSPSSTPSPASSPRAS